MSRRDRVVVYRDQAGEWRWRYVRSNGRILADGAEGYKRRGPCIKAALTVTDRTHIRVEVQP